MTICVATPILSCSGTTKKLNIVYDIVDLDLQSLTIQPILSNAVSHGVGQKPGGGTVSVSVVPARHLYLCYENTQICHVLRSGVRVHLRYAGLAQRHLFEQGEEIQRWK